MWPPALNSLPGLIGRIPSDVIQHAGRRWHTRPLCRPCMILRAGRSICLAALRRNGSSAAHGLRQQAVTGSAPLPFL